MDSFNQALASGLDRGVRMQQLRSERAMQQLRERQVAQQLALQMDAHQRQIQQEADTAKAVSTYQLYSTPTLPTPQGPMPNPAFIPDPGMAYMKSFLPTAKDPTQAGKVMLDAATLNLRQAQTADETRMTELRGTPTPRAPSQVVADEALAEQRMTGADLNRARTEQVKTGRQMVTTTMRNLMALDEAELKGNETHIKALREQLKLDGLDEVDLIKMRSELRSLDNNILMPEAEKEQRRAVIYQRYEKKAAPKEQGGDTILMIDPKGKKWRVPAGKRDEFIQRFQMKEYEG